MKKLSFRNAYVQTRRLINGWQPSALASSGTHGGVSGDAWATQTARPGITVASTSIRSPVAGVPIVFRYRCYCDELLLLLVSRPSVCLSLAIIFSKPLTQMDFAALEKARYFNSWLDSVSFILAITFSFPFELSSLDSCLLHERVEDRKSGIGYFHGHTCRNLLPNSALVRLVRTSCVCSKNKRGWAQTWSVLNTTVKQNSPCIDKI